MNIHTNPMPTYICSLVCTYSCHIICGMICILTPTNDVAMYIFRVYIVSIQLLFN